MRPSVKDVKISFIHMQTLVHLHVSLRLCTRTRFETEVQGNLEMANQSNVENNKYMGSEGDIKILGYEWSNFFKILNISN